jgi:flagellar biosynthesis/type III secretory pathway M-ring protein FliF/YscJ
MMLIVVLGMVVLFVAVLVSLYIWTRNVERDDLPLGDERQLSDEERRRIQTGLGLASGGDGGGGAH